MAETSHRHPFLVVTPTGADADRLANDLVAYLGPDEVDVFAAWETLPFERVSPGLETMGRRLRTLWRLGTPTGRRASWWPRCGLSSSASAPTSTRSSR